MILIFGILAVLVLSLLFFLKMHNEEDSGEAILGMEFVRSHRYYYFKLDSNHILTVFRATPIPDEVMLDMYQTFNKTLDSIEFSKVHRRGRIELSEQEFDEIIKLAGTVDSLYEEGFRLLSTGSFDAIIYYGNKTYDVMAAYADPRYGWGEDSEYRYILHLHDKLIELSPIEISS